MEIKVLIIEDEISLRNSLKKLLELRGYQVEEAEDYGTAKKKMLSDKFNIFILDLKLPDKNGIELLKEFPEKTDGKTIIITAHATISSAVEAIKNGAFYYLEKPLDEDLLFIQMKKIIEYSRLKENNIYLKKELLFDQAAEQIIFQSQSMSRIIYQSKKLAETDDIVIIQGETGVGKEVIAHLIHRNSKRKNNLFLPINCSAIPEQLFESELFGFKRGAFTGATKDYSGRFIQANGGTLFLDEISDMPMNLQSKLLRTLDDKIIYQLGNKNPQKIDIRLITATNKDLWKEVESDRFRKDLYFRLKETIIIISPLRERKDDILPLFNHFIALFNNIYDKNIKGISKNAEKYLLEYPWEGNVRELKNAVKSIFAFKEDDYITPNDLFMSLNTDEKRIKKYVVSLKEYENKYIKKVLEINNYNITKTADILGISRTRLYRKMEEFNLGRKCN
ncbi:MAG: sigma-54-dependent Fis family transcriptional regulator [Candidatus Aminicenantes bacterium]|nr:sigma-54-dependent Fis family transcriptional regulator [Candidatus Aminicenantes bacterium]